MQAVIFDCDGVLVDSEVTGLRVVLGCLADIGLTYDRHDYIERFLGSTWSDFYSRLDVDHRARLGGPLPVGFPAVVSARFAADAAADSVAIAGVHDLVAALGLPMAIASGSTPADLDKKLRRVGLFEIFAPHIYSAQIVAKGKPSPDIYLHAAAQLGVDPTACVAVEDSVNGVRSAVAAGMKTIGFVGGGHGSPRLAAKLTEAGAAEVADHMPALAEIFGRLS